MKHFSKFREQLDEHLVPGSLPPNILILRRKSVRAFPDSMVALYYNDKLDQYFSVPFGGDVENAITPASLKEDTTLPYNTTWVNGKLHIKSTSGKKTYPFDFVTKDQAKKKAELVGGKVTYHTPSSMYHIVKEDVESLDELNTPTLGSYLSKSVEQVKGHQAPFKRYKGMSRAISKLNLRTGHPDPKKSQAAKDALNISEEQDVVVEGAIYHLHKVTQFETSAPLKHKDGTRTKVDPTTAKALLTVHAALSDDNKKKFADHLEKSKDHFHRMVDFTWKQVK